VRFARDFHTDSLDIVCYGVKDAAREEQEGDRRRAAPSGRNLPARRVPGLVEESRVTKTAAVEALLSPEQASLLEQLAAGLSADQLVWASGYLAGRRGALAATLSDPRHGVTTDARPEAPALTVLFGSETGHSARIAAAVKARAEQRGFSTRVRDMATYRVGELAAEKVALLVTSTHGEGEPPGPAAELFEHLLGRRAPRLPGVRFAVLGLGDSTYTHFCKAARDLDARLEALGAERLYPRVDCDVDYEAAATRWADGALDAGAPHLRPQASRVIALHRPAQATPRVVTHDRGHPFSAPLLESLCLNGRGSDDHTLHLELSLADSGLSYEPGDAVGIAARNDPALVDELLATLHLDGSRPAGTSTLAETLATDWELTVLSPRFVEHWAELSGSSALRGLLAPERRNELLTYLHGRDVVDVVREAPVTAIAPDDLLGGLRRLQPRLYSIASSLAAHPDEAHLTVAVVSWQAHGRPHQGVTTGQLARAAVDDRVPLFIERNERFRLPADDAADIVMIGAGTGVAPFRAFIEERAVRGARGRSWLFFGARRLRTDFLYQLEWQRHLAEGTLGRMDVAFSRDQAEKLYVQHRIREQGRELYAWVEGGAHLYVCGDAKGMAPDVDRALTDVFVREGGLSPEAAAARLRALQRDGRYQRDVY
jgi:sulfite reductase (NADPH) flavoprotein alpha-component